MNTLQIDPPHFPVVRGLIDTHCHLDMRGYENLDEVINSSMHAGVDRIITVGTDFASSCQAVAIASRYENVFAAIGIHPHSASSVNTGTYRKITDLFADNRNRIVGYGEIGLDYVKKYAPREVQLREFRSQLALAADLDLPVIIHDRDAHRDTLEILKTHAPYPARGVMHCFSGDHELAWRIIDLGFYISIPGIVTFSGSDIMQKVVREIPLDHIILETDGPFLAPVPFRGKINKPEYLVHTAEKIAELKNMTFAEIAWQTTLNAETLFRLPAEETIH